MNQRELYLSLNAHADEDLLRHFPVRYESLKTTPLKENPEDGERFVVKGRVAKIKQVNSHAISMIRFYLNTFQGASIPCVLYNQPFYLNKLSAGKDLLTVLYYSESRKAYTVSSIYDLDSYFVMSEIKPVYTLPKEVPTSYFINQINKILSYPREADFMLSPIPPSKIQRYKLLNLFDAYRAIHRPRNDKMLREGLRVFKYEEALSFSVRALSLKRKAEQKKKLDTLKIPHIRINQFVKNLPYKLTSDQIRAIREIIEDMDEEKVMYRLLQGDVGTGKTIVAFTALYGNYLRGKQGVLMAPTFELVSQHYQNALKVFERYGIRVALLVGTGMKVKERREILEGVKNGDIDILISTTSALSDEIHFRALGLSIIDEQQRFGVEQREELVNKGESCDLLMMSATPIPRTFSQIIHADLDVTSLTEFPSGRRIVETRLINSYDPVLYRAIEKAIAAERQVFVVVPKITDGNKPIASAESVYKEICDRFGEDKTQLLHGRIRKENQEEIIKNFKENSRPILVSTTVIEVGIDVSNAGLLVIYDANQFGLSSLHQLRGRVGRSGEYALCLLVYDGKDKDAKEKLQFMAEHNDGFEISQFDLKQRGSGSYSGSNQSGKSELSVCNFVDDINIFEAARKDAEEILDHPEIEENSRYLKSIKQDEDIHLV